MIFGVFVARKDTPIDVLQEAHAALLTGLVAFEDSDEKREAVIQWAMGRSDLSHERLDQYFGEVFNRLDPHHMNGLHRFLSEACHLPDELEFAW